VHRSRCTAGHSPSRRGRSRRCEYTRTPPSESLRILDVLPGEARGLGTLAVSLGPTGRGERRLARAVDRAVGSGAPSHPAPGSDAEGRWTERNSLNEKKRFKKNLKGWCFSSESSGCGFELPTEPGSDEGNLRLGSRKGAHCPKWEVPLEAAPSRCSIAGDLQSLNMLMVAQPWPLSGRRAAGWSRAHVVPGQVAGPGLLADSEAAARQ
jgi:hypothetical protein